MTNGKNVTQHKGWRKIELVKSQEEYITPNQVYKTEAGMSRSRLAAEIESKDSKSDDDFIPDFLRPKSV